MKEDARLTNIAMDYVVNDIIVHLGVLHNDKPSVTIGEDWYYDSKYHNWSVNDVIKDLKKQQKHDPKKFETKYGKGSFDTCLLYTSPSPRDRQKSRMPSSA